MQTKLIEFNKQIGIFYSENLHDVIYSKSNKSTIKYRKEKNAIKCSIYIFIII